MDGETCSHSGRSQRRNLLRPTVVGPCSRRSSVRDRPGSLQPEGQTRCCCPRTMPAPAGNAPCTRVIPSLVCICERRNRPSCMELYGRRRCSLYAPRTASHGKARPIARPLQGTDSSCRVVYVPTPWSLSWRPPDNCLYLLKRPLGSSLERAGPADPKPPTEYLMSQGEGLGSQGEVGGGCERVGWGSSSTRLLLVLIVTEKLLLRPNIRGGNLIDGGMKLWWLKSTRRLGWRKPWPIEKSILRVELEEGGKSDGPIKEVNADGLVKEFKEIGPTKEAVL
ncbi:nucleotidyltransferase family protein [Striga asiatica]|uniref:Nucleotidyltransferase family protein n=1 Tax=Striga asiatica TaxID=4170 RepID=A0A5A7NZK9_STRAF|nr:nucleotidyltransferase family protein [Striga asiatica]